MDRETVWQWEIKRRGRREGRGGGREWDLGMIIRLLGKALTENSLPTSWSPDSIPPFPAFLLPAPSTYPSSHTIPPSPPHSTLLSFLFFFLSTSLFPYYRIPTQQVSDMEAWLERERERPATIMWLPFALPFTFIYKHTVHAHWKPFSTGSVKFPK